MIADEFGKSVGTAGIVVTAFALPYGACQLIFGPIGDRIGKLRIIALSLGCSTIFTVATGFVDTLESLAILRFMTGVTLAATVPLSMVYIADEVPYPATRYGALYKRVSFLVISRARVAEVSGPNSSIGVPFS